MKDPKERLGCKEGIGILEIKNHTFFEGLDWKKLLHMKIKPPFIPKQIENEPFISLSDHFPIDQNAEQNDYLIREYSADLFEGFSFVSYRFELDDEFNNNINNNNIHHSPSGSKTDRSNNNSYNNNHNRNNSVEKGFDLFEIEYQIQIVKINGFQNIYNDRKILIECKGDSKVISTSSFVCRNGKISIKNFDDDQQKENQNNNNNNNNNNQDLDLDFDDSRFRFQYCTFILRSKATLKFEEKFLLFRIKCEENQKKLASISINLSDVSYDQTDVIKEFPVFNSKFKCRIKTRWRSFNQKKLLNTLITLSPLPPSSSDPSSSLLSHLNNNNNNNINNINNNNNNNNNNVIVIDGREYQYEEEQNDWAPVELPTNASRRKSFSRSIQKSFSNTLARRSESSDNYPSSPSSLSSFSKSSHDENGNLMKVKKKSLNSLKEKKEKKRKSKRGLKGYFSENENSKTKFEEFSLSTPQNFRKLTTSLTDNSSSMKMKLARSSSTNFREALKEAEEKEKEREKEAAKEGNIAEDEQDVPKRKKKEGHLPQSLSHFSLLESHFPLVDSNLLNFQKRKGFQALTFRFSFRLNRLERVPMKYNDTDLYIQWIRGAKKKEKSPAIHCNIHIINFLYQFEIETKLYKTLNPPFDFEQKNIIFALKEIKKTNEKKLIAKTTLDLTSLVRLLQVDHNKSGEITSQTMKLTKGKTHILLHFDCTVQNVENGAITL